MLWLNREEFTETFKELYTSPGDLDTYLSNIASLELIDNFIVSDRKLSELAAAGLSKIHDCGYIYIPVSGEKPRRLCIHVRDEPEL